MQETFYTTATNLVALTSDYGTIRSLAFNPTSQTKYLILAQCAAGVTYNNITDACQTVLGPAVLLLNGTTVAATDIGNLQAYYCLDALVGTTYTLELKAKRLHTNGSDYAYCARIAAIGMDNWYRIEQGVDATLTGVTTNTTTPLMQDILEPMLGNCLVFSYAEVQPDTVQNLRGRLTFEFDSNRVRDQRPIDLIVQQQSGFKEDYTDISYGTSRWNCVSSVNLVDFEGSRTNLQVLNSKLDGLTYGMSFRRLRTVLIPTTMNSFGHVHYQYSKGGSQFTGTQTDLISMVPHPRTATDFDYLVLGSCKTELASGDGPVQSVFRYDGLGMAGSTTNLVGISGNYSVAATTAMYAAGITFGIRNDDILAIKTYNLSAGTTTVGYTGQQQFGFNVVGATQVRKDSYYFFSSAQYQSTEETVSRTGDRFMAVVLLPT